MIISSLILLLILSFSIHINYLTKYVIKKEKRYLLGFINTAITNIIAAISLSVLAMNNPEYVVEVNLRLLLWMISGLVTIIMLALKISIFRRIYKRTKNPENFHYNFFGKKVLHDTVVHKNEVMMFFITVPIFLLIGSYFVARLLNYVLYNHM